MLLSFLCSYYRGIRQMVQVSDQDMNTHLAEISRVSKKNWSSLHENLDSYSLLHLPTHGGLVKAVHTSG